MTPEEKYIKKHTFFCKKMNARISKKACNLNQHKIDTGANQFSCKIGHENNSCRNCKTGKKHYIRKKKGDREIREKECFIHRVAPEMCESHQSVGIFKENINIPAEVFGRKKYCSPNCSKLSTYQKYKDLMKRL